MAPNDPKPKAKSSRLPTDGNRNLASDSFRFRKGPSDVDAVELRISSDAFLFLGGTFVVPVVDTLVVVFIVIDGPAMDDVPSCIAL